MSLVKKKRVTTLGSRISCRRRGRWCISADSCQPSALSHWETLRRRDRSARLESQAFLALRVIPLLTFVSFVVYACNIWKRHILVRFFFLCSVCFAACGASAQQSYLGFDRNQYPGDQ